MFSSSLIQNTIMGKGANARSVKCLYKNVEVTTKCSHSVTDGLQAETDTFAEVPSCLVQLYPKGQDMARPFSGMLPRCDKQSFRGDGVYVLF